jgi:alpha-D-ribose 1-methylphosphonate 5-triphosphate synthase subunit PhnH
MTVIREVSYDEVFDAQKHFRVLLDSVARPGRINCLESVDLTPPPGLNKASVLVAFALLDANTTFAMVNMERGEGSYLSANTQASRTAIEDAGFIFADGGEAPEILESANCGALAYPDTAATLILQVAGVSTSPLAGGLQLTLRGPGIDGIAVLFVQGLNPDLLLALQARNAEFPLGLDTLLTLVNDADIPCVIGIPRTTKVSWEAC